MMDHNGEFGGFLKEVRETALYAERTDELSRPANRPAVIRRLAGI